jgi:hypothetical protein
MAQRIFRLLALGLIVVSFVGIASASPYEPTRNSAERRAILDALRPAVERQLQPPVEFLVSHLLVDQGWAFVSVEPQRPGGAAIDVDAVGFDMDMRDGLTTWALLRKQSGGWRIVEWVLGPSDVAWHGWWDTYDAPREIFP